MTAVDRPLDTQRVPALRKYLAVIRRRRLAVALCIALPLIAGGIYTLHKGKLYQGTAQVVINRQNLANALTNTPDPNSSAANFVPIVQTQAAVARAPSVADVVVASVPAAHLTRSTFLAESSVQPQLNADILTFQAANSRPDLALRLTNTYAAAFVNYRRQLDTSALALARSQIELQLRQLSKSPIGGARAAIAQLTAKDSQLSTLETLQTANAQVVATAVTAAKISPRPVKYGILGLLAGLLLAGLVAWLLEALDTRVRSSTEIGEALGIPLLGRLLPPPRLSAIEPKLATLARPRSTDSEAFRILRMNLAFASLDKDIRTFMVTSAVEREGKSTTIANLAVILARAGSHVVLVDLDLRRPAVESLFELPRGPGLTNVALGRITLDEALEPIELDARDPDGDLDERKTALNGRLEVLRAGSIPPDPGEFVASPSVAEILTRVRERADYVLVDAPPTLPVGDALALSRLVDGIIVVTRLRVLRRHMLQSLASRLQNSPAALLGFIVTGDVRDEASEYGYGYGYGYGKAYLGDEPQGPEGSMELSGKLP